MPFAWQHIDITWNNVELSLVKLWGFHMRAILQEVLKLLCSTMNMNLKIVLLKLLPYLPGDLRMTHECIYIYNILNSLDFKFPKSKLQLF